MSNPGAFQQILQLAQDSGLLRRSQLHKLCIISVGTMSKLKTDPFSTRFRKNANYVPQSSGLKIHHKEDLAPLHPPIAW